MTSNNNNSSFARPTRYSETTEQQVDMFQRITLKMDVSFCDHSHIIGKGGRSIQSVMNECGKF